VIVEDVATALVADVGVMAGDGLVDDDGRVSVPTRSKPAAGVEGLPPTGSFPSPLMLRT
jgi:hypothetical protein